VFPVGPVGPVGPILPGFPVGPVGPRLPVLPFIATSSQSVLVAGFSVLFKFVIAIYEEPRYETTSCLL